jgi:hypothetical protein
LAKIFASTQKTPRSDGQLWYQIAPFVVAKSSRANRFGGHRRCIACEQLQKCGGTQSSREHCYAGGAVGDADLQAQSVCCNQTGGYFLRGVPVRILRYNINELSPNADAGRAR